MKAYFCIVATASILVGNSAVASPAIECIVAQNNVIKGLNERKGKSEGLRNSLRAGVQSAFATAFQNGTVDVNQASGLPVPILKSIESAKDMLSSQIDSLIDKAKSKREACQK